MHISSHHEEHTILIVDSNRLFRDKLMFLLQDQLSTLNIDISSQSSLSEITLGSTNTIDVLLIEGMQLLKIEEMTLLSKIYTQNPNIKIFLMSEHVSSTTPTMLIGHHGLAYQVISKKILAADLVQMIDQAINPDHHSQIHTHDSLNQDHFENLTPREVEILNYIVGGQSNKEIARSLFISESTVKVHVQNILKKFDVTSRVEAAVYAVRQMMI